jgi:hypothetical protein
MYSEFSSYKLGLDAGIGARDVNILAFEILENATCQ